MDDMFFSNDNRSSKRDRSNINSPYNEPHYEYEPSEDDVEELFSSTSKNKAPFTVNIPDETVVYQPREKNQPSDPSRIPKGRPVGSSQYQQAQYSQAKNVDRTPKGARKGQSSTASSSTYKPKSTAANSPSKQRSSYSAYSSKTKSTRSKTSYRPPRKKSSNAKKIAIAVLSVVVVLFAALFAYGYSILGKINYEPQSVNENPYISSSSLASDSKVKNILFIGSDARSEIQGMRSDTMILFSIDKANKKIKLTSFLRDSYVCIPSSMKYRKLNAACSSGGAELVIDTIEYNFKTKIDSYVLVDFEVFTKFIDLLGGLDVPDVSASEAKYLRDKVKIVYAKEGDNHFSGAATLWYCRIRYLDDDFHRTQRQRKVISAIISQVAKTSPAKLVNIVDEIMPMITTDISRNEMMSLAMGALVSYLHYDILQHQIPAKGTWSNATVYGSGAVLKMDIDENARLLEEFLYSEYVPEEETQSKK